MPGSHSFCIITMRVPSIKDIGQKVILGKKSCKNGISCIVIYNITMHRLNQRFITVLRFFIFLSFLKIT